ncbi:MAG TPA: hypothetical protein VGG75_16625 [Trebonia sp.]|jgi:pimeloyl-ACP methyl ester carboxylesterase
MTTHLIFAHSPLLGPSTWEPVAAELARAGYRVSVPDLSGTVAAGPPYGRPQAEIIARSEDGDPPSSSPTAPPARSWPRWER